MKIGYGRYNSTRIFCEFDLWFANLQPQVDVNETFIARSEIIQITVFFIIHCKFEIGPGNHFCSKKKNKIRQMHPFSYRLWACWKWTMVSKCRVWEIWTFRFTLVFYETFLSNIKREAKHEEHRTVGKAAVKTFVWNPVESLSPALQHSESNLLDPVPQRRDWEE